MRFFLLVFLLATVLAKGQVITPVNVGPTPRSGLADTPRNAFIKLNGNDTNIKTRLDSVVLNLGGGGSGAQTTIDVGILPESTLYGVLKGTVGAVTNTKLLSYRTNSARALSDNLVDAYVGSNNGNPSAIAGGNIAVGNGNLSLITPGGTWSGTPWWSYFRGDRNISIGTNNGINLRGIASNGASGNLLFGQSVLQLAQEASYNIFAGFQTAQNFNPPSTGVNGDENIGIGNYVLQTISAGKGMYNLVMGEAAYRYGTSVGEQNIILGPSTARNTNFLGDFNTIIGPHAMEDVSFTSVSGSTLNSYNTAIGMFSMERAIQGSQHLTAIGSGASRWGGGSNNASVGTSSGYGLRGDGNISIGLESAHTVGNVYNFLETGSSITTPYVGSNSTFLGYRSGFANASAAISNVMVIGNNYQPTLTSGDIYVGAPRAINFVTDTDLSPKNALVLNEDGTVILNGVNSNTFSLNSHNHSGVYEPANANIQSHVLSTHAPADAQKNSDITKAEIEAKLTGVISSHSHSGSGAAWGGITGTLADQTDLSTALNGKQVIDSDLTTIAGLAATTDNIIQSKAGAWASRTVAQFKTDLTLVKADVGLSNVDNTSDVTKNSATVTLTNKTLTSPVINTPTGIVKADVGLGSVDNTSDASKPVSTAQQTALDGKQTLDSDLTTIAGLAPTNGDMIQRVTGVWANRTMAQVKTDLVLVKADVGLSNVDNTTDANKPVSTAQQTALDLKANLASPTFTGTPTFPTGAISVTQSAGNSTTAIASTAFVTTADNLKANLAGPTFTGTVVLPSTTSIGTITNTELGFVDGVTSALQTQLDLKAPLASPALTGTPTAPTAGVGNNTTQIATTAFVLANGAGGTPPTILILASDVTTGANTTPVNLTGMSFTYAVNDKYIIEIHATVNSAVATTGYGFGVNCTTAPVLVTMEGSGNSAAAGTGTSWSSIANNAIVSTTVGTPTAATNTGSVGGGVFVMNATTGGTAQFIYRSETTAATTCKANTVIRVTKIN